MGGGAGGGSGGQNGSAAAGADCMGVHSPEEMPGDAEDASLLR